MSQALVNRSLTTIKTELEFLLDSNVITKSLFDHITQSLPEKYSQGMPAADLKADTKSASSALPAGTPPASNPEYAEALYDYHPQKPDDLELRVGSKIIVQEKMSSSWWRGTSDGKTGVFPANYVKIVGGGSNEKAAYAQQQQQPQQVYYQQSAPQPMQQYQPPPQYTAPPVAVVQSQPQPVQVQQQQEHHHSAFGGAAKKFGSKLGNAAIFGAGATIGSDIVNSIF
ncbi:unnamed protein product [Ambrosiozyma monospora]|uniref:Unnamed protein product n=1 Tax=Ambrosiozyma monospora TaxID=43982 RepID=A0ACB5T7I9_AMBMO|nr:unnamed protein product [Ambrosiozyma monospora]